MIIEISFYDQYCNCSCDFYNIGYCKLFNIELTQNIYNVNFRCSECEKLFKTNTKKCIEKMINELKRILKVDLSQKDINNLNKLYKNLKEFGE